MPGLVKGAGLAAVLVAAELALERAWPSGQFCPEQVGNVLAQRTTPSRPYNAGTALGALTNPVARNTRYERLRCIQGEPAAEQGAEET